MKILIVDDHPINRKLLRVILESQGHEVQEAEDGIYALKLLDSGKFEMMIADILMPNMDGYRLCFEARQISLLKDLPIVLYSSTYLDPSDRDLALRFGANAFVQKPTSPGRWQEIVSELTAHTTPAAVSAAGDELGVLKQYSERLVRKLEERNLELYRRTEELKDSEEMFRQLAENIQEVFWIGNPDASEIYYISPAYQRVWGRSCKDLYEEPRSWFDAIHPDDRERVAAAGGPDKGSDFECRVVRPDGSIRWIHARGFPVRNSAGEIYRIAGLAEDITERKLLESQLMQAQKMEAVGRFAGGIAHDFNNLLTAINGFSELALDQLPEGDPARTAIAEVCKAGQRAAGLTGQLLAFSRKQVLKPRVLDLNVVVSDIERLLQRLIGTNIELVSTLSANLGRTRVDPGQLEQVIMNLALNARDAMPHGGMLSLTTANAVLDESHVHHSGAAAGRYVMLTVEDTGTGMTDEVQAQIFEPFFTTKELGKGTGLGLSTVHGIVRQSGGHIGVHSQLGHGTTFQVYLPLVNDAPDPDLPIGASQESSKGIETVLLVEDEGAVRSLANQVLAGAGYQVLQASCGEDALMVARQHLGRIHLLLTDIVMPGMSSPDLARALTALQPDVHVLYMSGYAAALFRDAPIASDQPFLAKPFTIQKLLAAVRQALEGARSEDPAKPDLVLR